MTKNIILYSALLLIALAQMGCSNAEPRMSCISVEVCQMLSAEQYVSVSGFSEPTNVVTTNKAGVATTMSLPLAAGGTASFGQSTLELIEVTGVASGKLYRYQAANNFKKETLMQKIKVTTSIISRPLLLINNSTVLVEYSCAIVSTNLVCNYLLDADKVNDSFALYISGVAQAAGSVSSLISTAQTTAQSRIEILGEEYL